MVTFGNLPGLSLSSTVISLTQKDYIKGPSLASLDNSYLVHYFG